MNEPEKIVEFRGVTDLVAAEVLRDDNAEDGGYITGDVFAIAGVAEISRAANSSSAVHYYNNRPAVVVENGVAADTVTISVSAIPLNVRAKINGQHYNAATGSLVEGPRKSKYFAVGYKTKNTDGDEMYVWRLKGKFSVPDEDNKTDDDSTDANGQQLVYTGIMTNHVFANSPDENGRPSGAKAHIVDTSKGLADVSTFFDCVTDPDQLVPIAPPAEDGE